MVCRGNWAEMFYRDSYSRTEDSVHPMPFDHKEQAHRAKSTIIAKFCDATTLHGIRYFAGPGEHWLARLIWFALVTFSLGSCCFMLYPSYKSFIDGEVRTALYIDPQRTVPFPALTFCNVNGFRKSAISTNLAIRNQFMMIKRWANVNQMQVVCPLEEQPRNEYLKTFQPITSSITDLFLVSHDAFQSVIKCTFRGMSCNSNIVNHLTDFGICFTVNPGNQFRSPVEKNGTLVTDNNSWYPNIIGQAVNVSAAGYNAALDIILNAQVYEYCDSGGPDVLAAGFIMAIHHPAIEPWFKLQPSIGIEPGCRTEVVVRLRRYRRHTEHLNRCTSNVKLDYYKNKEYDQMSCFVECIVKKLNETCHCVSTHAPTGAIEIATRQMRVDGRQVEDYLCLRMENSTCVRKEADKILVGQSLSAACPHCQIACEEIQFVTEQLSTQMFPSNNTAPLFYNNKYPTFGPSSDWAFMNGDKTFRDTVQRYETYFKGNDTFSSVKEVQDNLLSVRVYFSQMGVETIVENPLTPISDLVVQLGGATGLFLGASLLSFVEIIHWALVGMVHAVKQRRATKRDRKIKRYIALWAANSRNFESSSYSKDIWSASSLHCHAVTGLPTTTSTTSSIKFTMGRDKHFPL